MLLGLRITQCLVCYQPFAVFLLAAQPEPHTAYSCPSSHRSLADSDQQVDSMLPHLSVPAGALGDTSSSFVSEVAGSGPWRWAGQGPFAFLRGGVLHTPWGNGKWGVQRSTAGGEKELATSNEVSCVVIMHVMPHRPRSCLLTTADRRLLTPYRTCNAPMDTSDPRLRYHLAYASPRPPFVVDLCRLRGLAALAHLVAAPLHTPHLEAKGGW